MILSKFYRALLDAKLRLSAIFLSVLIILIGLIGNSVTHNLIMTPDSLRYSLVTDEIERGNGLRLPLARYDSGPKLDVQGTTPFTVQPPGYPIILYSFKTITNNTMSAATIINWLSYMLIVLITGYIVWRDSDWIIATLATISIAFSLPVLKLASMYLSDLMFMAISMAAILMIVEAEERDSSYIFITLACIFTVFAILTRFAGVALIPVLLLGAVKCYLQHRNINIKVLAWLSSVVFSILLFSGLLYRNYMLTGSYRGFTQPVPDRSLTETIYGSVDSILFDNFSVEGVYIKIIIIGGLLLGMACLFVLWRWHPDLRNHLYGRLTTSTSMTILLFAASYFTLMLIALTNNQPHFESRFYTPLIPAFNIVFFLILHTVIQLSPQHRTSAPSIILMLSMLFVIANVWGSYKHQSILLDISEPHRITNNCAFKWLARHDSPDRILTNEPYVVAYYAGLSAVMLPSHAWNKGIQIPRDMETGLPIVMAKHDVEYLALFTYGDKLPEEHFGQFISDLSVRKITIKQLDLIYSCEDGLIYRLID